MIYHSSNDPIIIKKIYLKIWKLRDEIEYVANCYKQEKIERPEIVEKLINEYQEGPPLNDSYIGDNNNDLDTGEDEMAAALAAAENGEEEEESPEGTIKENTENPNLIKQRRPLITENKIIHGTLLLSEITMEMAFIFVNKPLSIGESIIIEYLVPTKFVTCAEVVSCKHFNLSGRIISKKKTPYRVALQFTFLKKGERTLLRQFIKSIETIVPKEEKSNNSTGAAKDNDDDFDELDDLDL